MRCTFLRRQVVFTEQSPVLLQAHKSLGLKTNVWIEDWVLTSHKLHLKKGHVPTKVTIWKGLELYNIDQLVDRATGLPVAVEMPAPVHSSFASQKPYGRSMAGEMDNIALMHGFEGKWWIGAGKVGGAQSPYALRDASQRASKFFFPAPAPLAPLDLVEGEAAENLRKSPISGSTRRFYRPHTSLSDALIEYTQRKGFQSNLFFSERQLQTAGLLTRPDADPFTTSTSSSLRGGGGSGSGTTEADLSEKSWLVIYNLEQVQDADSILASFGRYGEPDEAVFFLSGMPVPEVVQEAQSRFGLKYWITGRDIEENGWQLKKGEEGKGVNLARGGTQVRLYNVEELVNPAEGFARAGLLEMKEKSE